MTFVINGDFDGRSVRDWLYQNGVSRALITRLKRLDDGICVNSSRVTVRYILHTGDRLSLALDDRSEDVNENLVPSEIALDIIYENDDFVALNKPAGIATHPSQGHFRDTLANGLAAYYKKRGVPFVFRAVNRLDRETSGVVLCAKNQYAASRLSEELRAGRIKKTYIALLNGTPEPPSGNISVYIRRREASVILREVTSPSAEGAKLAVTEYETLAPFTCASRSEISPSGASRSEISQSGASRSGASRSEISHSGASQSGISQSGTSHGEISQSGTSRSGVLQTEISQSGTSQSEISQSGFSQSGASQSDIPQWGALQSETLPCDGAVVRAEPLTGRTHQLRVSFAHIGAPIVGDGLYGSAESAPTRLDKLAARHMLHALSLEFSLGGIHYILRAGLPCDMAELCRLVFGDGLALDCVNSVETQITPEL